MNILEITKITIVSTYALLGFVSQAIAEETVEWAPFIKNPQVTVQQLITSADEVSRRFLSLQPGFIKRQLVQKSDHGFSDIVYWKTQENAEQAAAKVATCRVCNQYFSLMNYDKSKLAGSGFSYYRILRAW
ncbi:MAG: hypothetical protein ACI9ES_001571 [Oceanospirillaceae bacterium]|jgi:hypothetical protein